MATFIAANGDAFESGCDLIEVTSQHRPDLTWRHVDADGHEHRWHRDGVPAVDYRPEDQYDVPTVRWVHDGYRYDEDGEECEVGHLACRECDETIKPRYRADDTKQYIPGLCWCRINGQSVSRDEFRERLKPWLEQGDE